MIGLLRRGEAALARALPTEWVSRLQRLKQRLPLELSLSAPVVQAYVNDRASRCHLGLHNFYSVLLPELKTDAVAAIEFRGPDGQVVLRHRQKVPHLGAIHVDVAALFRAHGVRAEVGIVSVQLTPRWPRRRAYRSLGQVTSHFFVHHESEQGAVGQIHPLSIADPANRAAGPFRSSQVISTVGMEALEIVQYNAIRAPHRLEHRLFDADTGATFATRSLDLAPLGAAVVRFPLAGQPGLPPRLGLSIDDLPSANAKPVLRRVYAGNLYSVSHA